MNVIKLIFYFSLFSLNVIERNSVFCMEEKVDWYDIGARYYEGNGVDVDKAEAVRCFLRAAEQGHVTALFRLAICYDLGDGVTQNKVEAAKYFQKAADRGHILAQFRIGACYEKGEGVKQDKKEALKYFQKSADQGNASAKQRVTKLNSELLKQSSKENETSSANEIDSGVGKSQANSTNKKFATKDHPINNTSPVVSQNHMKHPRQKNQKQNSQKTLSPEELKKAEEAAQKAMDELLAQEEEEKKLRMNKHSRGKSTKTKEKEQKKKEKKTGESESTTQITNLKKANEKPSGVKPGQVPNAKISTVAKPSANTHSPQTQKQFNAPKSKQNSPLVDNATKTIQTSNNNHLLIPLTNENEITNSLEKEGNKKDEKTKEPAQTVPIKSLKKVTEQSSSDKPGQVSNTKIPDVDKLSPIIHSPQMQKQNNASRHKKKGHLDNIAQTTQASNNNHTLVSTEIQKEETRTAVKEGNKIEEKKRNQNDCLAIQEIKEQEKKVELREEKNKKFMSEMLETTEPNIVRVNSIAANDGKEKVVVDTNQLLQANNQPDFSINHQTKPHKQKGKKILWSEVKDRFRREKIENQSEAEKGIAEKNNMNTVNSPVIYPTMSELPEQTESKNCFSSIASINDEGEKAVVHANQLLQVNNQPESSSDHQPKPHKQKSPKILKHKMKEILKRKKPENQDEGDKKVKAEGNTNLMRAPVLYPLITNSAARMHEEPRATPYSTYQIQYIQVPVPFPIKVPVYIPVPMASTNHNGDISKLWVPHTQIKYEDDKKIVTQWNNEGRGSTHIIHPDSYAIEQEYNHLDKRLRYLKNFLKMQGSQIEDEEQFNKMDSSSSNIIHHGGEAGKQKNEELKKKISYCEKRIQERELDSSK